MNNDIKRQFVESSHSYDGLKVTLKVDGHSIEDVVQAFEAVLRGCTYSFDGHLELVEDEDIG